MRLTAKIAAIAVLTLPCVIHAAPPSISDVLVKQDEARLVTISYKLGGAPAIVTLSAFTNGVRLAGTLLTNASGALNRRVEPGDSIQTITWQPRVTWPDQKITDGSFSVKLTAWALDNPPDYMAVDLTSYSNRIWYASADDVPGTPTNDLYKCDWMLFRRIHAEGVRWRMGANGDTTGKYVPHHVTFTNDYYMAIFEMTIGQRTRIVSGTAGGFYPDRSTSYDALRGTVTGHDWPTDGHAVASDSVIGKLRKLTGLDGIDLPTSAEWEYASLAGRTALFHWGYDISQGNYQQYEWNSTMVASAEVCRSFGGDGSKSAQRVGLLKPNPWGLYDTHGNVFERCLDWYAIGAAYCEPGSEVIGPVGPVSGTLRVIHGGGYTHGYSGAYVSHLEGYGSNSSNGTNVGYRLACHADLSNIR